MTSSIPLGQSAAFECISLSTSLSELSLKIAHCWGFLLGGLEGVFMGIECAGLTFDSGFF